MANGDTAAGTSVDLRYRVEGMDCSGCALKIEGAVEPRPARRRQPFDQRRRIDPPPLAPEPPADHLDEGRAEPGRTGEVLVAIGLIDPPLAAERGLDRRHRDAVRFR